MTVKVTLLFERHIAAWTVEFWSSMYSIKMLPSQVIERQPVNSQVFGERKENEKAETHFSREISGQ
jgi:hypothetical protein